MVIAGHTDTSGTPKFNFKLSDERARNVLYILTGEREKWADVSAGRHKIEDYQQIMKYFAKKKGWMCDPENIDNKWGDKTKKACREFFKQTVPGSEDSIVAEIETNGEKKWPKRAWLPVFDLYIEVLCKVIGIKPESLKDFAANTLRYVNDDKKSCYVSDSKKYVACGESFPIDDREKKNYRSQVNRRVEVIIFDEDEKPDLKCPTTDTVVHKETECPLWDKKCYLPLYIDPKDLYAVVYHLRFVYYDRIKGKLMSVPEGLQIKAYEKVSGKAEDQVIPTETIFRDGVYNVKVQFPGDLNDPARLKVYFQFDTSGDWRGKAWIYTENKDKDPKIVYMDMDDYKKKSLKEQWTYYDLPEIWSSQNYWTRYDVDINKGDINKGDRFEKVFKDEKKLKPFGGNKTTSDKPLVFSLDDIVLVDNDRRQDIKDQDSTGSSKNLDANSRYTLFYVDDSDEPGGYKKITSYKDKKGKIKIHKQDSDEPVFTKGDFKENLIHDVPAHTRIVYFCNGFYDVYDKRSKKTDTNFNAGSHVLGARLAIKDDSDVHANKAVIASDAGDKTNAYALDNCGNYELHYFHNCGILNNKP